MELLCKLGIHDWHKALYSEWCDRIGKSKPTINPQLYGTKICGRCGSFGEGYAKKDHPILTLDTK